MAGLMSSGRQLDLERRKIEREKSQLLNNSKRSFREDKNESFEEIEHFLTEGMRQKRDEMRQRNKEFVKKY